MNETMSVKPLSNVNLTLTGALGVLGGIWLIVSPYLFDYSSTVANAAILGIICGVVAIVLSGFAIATEKMANMQTYRFAAGIGLILLGILLVCAPYLFNYSKLRDPLWNLQVTGGIFIVIAGFVMQELYTRSQEGNL